VKVRSVAVAALCVLAVLAGVGCEPDKRWNRRVEARLDQVERTGTIFVKSEAARPTKLGRTLARADKTFRKDVERAPANAARADRLARRDIDRFVKRLPVYERTFLRLFWAKPETIDETAISLFP